MTNITDKAMLVSLSIEKWSARKHDKTVSDAVARDHGATAHPEDVGRYNKVLVAKEALESIAKIDSEARGHHYANTLAWDDDGWRILPAENYFSYAEAQSAFRRRFETAVSEFTDGYPCHVEAARARLGDLFREEDYPHVELIARRFGMSTRVQPMPTAGDFRVNIGAEEEARIRADIEARLESATEDAMRELWGRVHKSVKHMAERLRGYQVDPETGKASGVFRDSLVGNLRELADLLPRLNVTGDSELAHVHQELVTHLCAHDPQTLRDSPTARTETAAAADAILARMSGYTAAA